MRPTRRNDPPAAAIRAAPALSFQRHLKTRPATTEPAAWGIYVAAAHWHDLERSDASWLRKTETHRHWAGLFLSQ